MIEAFVERLGGCRSEREFFRVHTQAETNFTPLEIHELLDRAGGLPQPTQAWLDRITRFTRFRENPPMRFRRKEIADNIDLYGDPDFARSGKRLIIGFCGTAQRLLMPIASMLQELPSQRCDLLVLRDPTLRHFLAGIAPYADNFWSLLKSLVADLQVREYAQPLLLRYMHGRVRRPSGRHSPPRTALHLGQRVISVACPPASRGAREGSSCFDPLCDCYHEIETRLVCAYSMAHKRDREQRDALVAHHRRRTSRYARDQRA